MSPAKSPRTRLRRILILGAWEPEIAPLRPLARALARRRGGPRLHLDVTGVGLVDAALGTTAALDAAKLDGRPGDACLFVGTAGLYASGRKGAARSPSARRQALGRPVIARRVRLASVAVARGHGYWPPPLVRTLEVDASLRAAIRGAAPGVASADVATTLAITSRPALAKQLARALDDEDDASRGPGTPRADEACALVENLEAFAVARACARRGVAFAAVLGVSNVVGPSAHAEWKRLADAASTAVAATLGTWLDPPDRRARR